MLTESHQTLMSSNQWLLTPVFQLRYGSKDRLDMLGFASSRPACQPHDPCVQLQQLFWCHDGAWQMRITGICLQELKVAALQQDLDAQRAALGRCSKSPNLTPDLLQVACCLAKNPG